MHRMCDFLCHAIDANLIHVVHGLHRVLTAALIAHTLIHLRTWYTDCIGKHAQILLHIRRRFYLIVLILADVR